jgi:integrase/recombinase XerD
MDLRQHLEGQGYAPRTVDSYCEIAARVGDQDPIDWFESRVAERLPVGTLLPERAAARAILIADGADPAEASAALAPAKGLPTKWRHPLTDAQLSLYRKSVREMVPGACRALLLLLPETGLRIAEACRLTAEHVVKVGPLRSLRFPGKRDKWRDVPLNQRARVIVDALQEANPEGYVFQGYRSSHITPHAVRKWTRAIAKAEPDLEGLVPHVLRHTFATNLMRKGAQLRYLQALLGHADVTTTSRYTHPVSSDLFDAVSLLDE